jgi:pimeloyl-ACP methyl ester carboxylesterase
LALVAFAKLNEHKPERVDVVGLNGGGAWVAAAAALAGPSIDRVAIDTAGFRFQRLASFDDPAFLPGAVKYGDLPALLALSAPRRLWLAGEKGDSAALARKSYTAAGQPANLVEYNGDAANSASEAVNWLLKE